MFVLACCVMAFWWGVVYPVMIYAGKKLEEYEERNVR